MSNLKKLLFILNKKQKTNLVFLSLILLIVSIIEIFFLHSVLIIVEFLNTKNLRINNYFQFEGYQTVSVVLIIFATFFLFKALINILAIRYEAHFLFKTRESLTNDFFNKYTNLPKLFQVKLSLAGIVKKIIIQVESLTVAMRALSTLFLEITILILISIYLLTVNLYATMYIFLIFTLSSLILLKINKNKIVNFGKEIIIHNEKRLKYVNEIFLSLKFFKNKKFNETIKKNFYEHNYKLNNIEILVAFKNGYIRPLFELVILIILVSVILFVFANNYELKDFLPQFAVFLAACYRLMPSYARIMTAIQNYKYNIQPVNEYFQDIKTIFEKNKVSVLNENIKFEKEIKFENIDFNYLDISNEKNDNLNIFKNLQFSIKKNSKICLVGGSGAGKSTFLDLIMGIIDPSTGNIYIDNKKQSLNNTKWQEKIGFASQNIFITNDTIKKNIAFGYEDDEIDDQKVDDCLKICNLFNFVENLEKGKNTKLSDLGTNISGGQKQRIGIARALYNSPSILILDEPTNNLDENNENDVIQNLTNLENTTLIITTHKKNLTKFFDRTYEIKNKEINLLK